MKAITSQWRTPIEVLGDIIRFKPEITFNTERKYDNGKKAPDGIEIRFGTNRPTEELRSKLKAAGFRFSEKQKMWYAYDNSKSREFLKEVEEVDVDNTQYEKLNFWATVKSKPEYNKLNEYTEFSVKQIADFPEYYYNKKSLEKDYYVDGLINKRLLSFKKFYNKVINQNETPSEEKTEPTKTGKAVAEKLRTLAEGMTAQIQAKINSAIGRQRPTARRVRIAASMAREGYEMKKVQNFLFALATAHETGKIKDYPRLKPISNRSQAELIINFPTDANVTVQLNHFRAREANYQKLGYELPNDVSQAYLDMQRLMETTGTKSDQPDTTDLKIKQLERELVGRKIPGFFPTPKDLIERLIEQAEIDAGQTVLEPSAGKGDILDVLKEKFGDSIGLSAIEINASLREILSLKGFPPIATDFLAFKPDPDGLFDRVIMNPPFENGLDIDHVLKAFACLAPSGRLVAIMGEGVFFRNFRKEQAFRDFLTTKGADISEPIKEAFKNGFNSTAITVRIVTIDRESEKQLPKQSPSVEELEALAEIELLKLELELGRKRPLSGTGDRLRHLEQIAWEKKLRWEALNFK